MTQARAKQHLPFAGPTHNQCRIYVILAVLGALFSLPVWAQSESVSKAGISGATPPGGSGTTTINWTIDYGLSSSGPLANVTLNDTWPDAQTLVAASVQTPGGLWSSSSPTATQLDFTAALVAPNAKGQIQPFPRPLASGVLLQNAGDGFVPVITANGRVMGINHAGTQIWCYDLNAGAPCNGYPMSSGINTGIAPYTVSIGNRIYFNSDSRDNQCCSAPGPDGIFCWDASTDAPCGQSGPTGKSSLLTVANGKLFTLNEAGKLLCFDPANGLAACAGFTPVDLGMPANTSLYTSDDMLAVGSKLFIASPLRKLTCFDVASNTTCAGWPGLPTVIQTTPNGDARSNLFPRLSPGGTVTGVCVAGNGTDATCYSDVDSSQHTEVALAGTNFTTYPDLTWGRDVSVGSRVFFADREQNIGCFDWATGTAGAPCVDSGFVNGHTSQANAVYGLTTDGVTVFSYGDGATLQSWNPITGVTPSDRAAAIVTVDVDSFYCGATTPIAATWDKVTLSDIDLTPGVEFTSLMVSLTDTKTGAVVFGPTEAVGTSGSLDVSSVSSSIRALRLEVDEAPVNTVAWDDNVPPKASLTFTNGTPVQFCFQTQVTCTGSGADYSNTINSTVDPHNATAMVTACAPSPYLTVSKSQPAPTLVPGQQSTYTLTITNIGNLSTSTATVKDALPVGLDLVSAVGTGWTCTPSSGTSPVGTITCNFAGTIADSGGTSSIDITVTPEPAYGSSPVINYVAIDPIGGTNVPPPSTCSGVDAPRAGCGAPVASSIGPTPCTLLPDGTSCDDGDANTVGDVCTAGVCAGIDHCIGVTCTASDQCHVAGICIDHATGACSDPTKADGTACDDGNACTLHDQCDAAGSCMGQSYAANYVVLAGNKVVLGQGTKAETDPMAGNADVCAFDIDMKPSSQIAGDAVALRSTPSAGPRFPAFNFRKDNTVDGDCVTGGGWLKHPENANIGGRTDRSGTAPELAECMAASCTATTRQTDWGNLPATSGLTLGSIRLKRGQTLRIPTTGTLGTGQIVIDTTGIRLGNLATLTLAGGSTTDTVIVRVHGSLRLGRPAHIALEGLTPEQVIFVVDQGINMHSFDTVAGSMLAMGDIRIGSGSTVDGAVVTMGGVRLGNFVTVNEHPFVDW